MSGLMCGWLLTHPCMARTRRWIRQILSLSLRSIRSRIRSIQLEQIPQGIHRPINSSSASPLSRAMSSDEHKSPAAASSSSSSSAAPASSSSSSSSSGMLPSGNIEAIATSMEWSATEQHSGGMSSDYQLSAQLNEGHDYAVRDVACSGPNVLATLEEKGRVAVFERVSTGGGASLGEEPPMEWIRSDRVEARAHNSLAFVLENVEGCAMKGEARSSGTAQTHYPRGTFMSGGGDKAARPWTANGSGFAPLSTHNGPVCSISCTYPDRMVLTGSWDGVVRMWHGDELLRSFDKLGHEHGTEVLGLQEGGRIVTASTTGAIVIIDAQGKVLTRVAGAHSAPIRKLIAHPLGFATAANDGLVKVWNEQGQLLQTIEAHTSSEVKFIYGLCFLRGVDDNLDRSRLVTCGEDGFVRVFNLAGDNIQEIPHPGPVRSVKPLGDDAEGDFMSACADKSVRVFTRCEARFAPEKLREEFRDIGALVKAAGGMKQLDTSTLQNESALAVPGTKNGQVKVLNITGRSVPIAYQWSDDLQEWVELGEAMGAGAGGGGNVPQQSRSKIDGVEYDFVSDIYLTDEHVVKLGFNADDDPDEVTDRFCALYSVPHDMRQQIIDFVRPKCDPVAGAQRKSRLEAQAASKVVLQQVPSWTSGSFEAYSQANVVAMEKKIRETNAALAAQQHPHALSGESLKSLNDLFASIRDPTQFHVAPFTAGEVSVVRHLMQWPTEHILPVLDCVRVLMVHSGANQALGADEQMHTLMFQHVKEGKKDTHKILAIKIVSNWVAKRTRSPSERYEQPSVPKSVTDYLVRAVEELADAASSDNENLALAYVMLLHNIICWFGRLKIAESEFYPLIASSLCELLNHKRNSKIQFFALLTLGSIAFASSSARDLLRSTFSEPFTAFIQQAAQSDNAALKQVANDCKLLYQL